MIIQKIATWKNVVGLICCYNFVILMYYIQLINGLEIKVCKLH